MPTPSNPWAIANPAECRQPAFTPKSKTRNRIPGTNRVEFAVSCIGFRGGLRPQTRTSRQQNPPTSRDLPSSPACPGLTYTMLLAW
eukprot:1186966-Rhodomonas_salina.1